MSDFFGPSMSRRRFLTTSALTGVGIAGGGALLSGCGGGESGGAGPAAAKGAVTWASWANPGEAERFKE